MTGRALAFAATLAALVAAWWAYTALGHVPPYLLPAPGAVAAALAQLVASGRLWPHLVHTLWVLLAGLAAGSAAGTALGFALGRSPRAAALLGPFIVLFQSAPKIGLAPLFVLWFGLGGGAHFALVVSLVLFPVMVGAMAGLRGIDPNLPSLARLLRLSPWRRFWRIELPAAADALFGGLRVAAVQALVGAILAEWISGKVGLGYLMVYGSTTYNTPLLLAAVVLTALLGLAAYQAVLGAERLALAWRE